MILGYFFSKKSNFIRSLVAGSLFLVFEASLLLLSGFIENTFFLDKKNVGVFEHYYAWTAILGDFLLFSVLYKFSRYIWQMKESFPLKYSRKNKKYLKSMQLEMLYSFLLKKQGFKILFLFFLIFSGMYFFFDNLVRHQDSIKSFNATLFDSIEYPIGYWSMKLILATSWILLLPYFIYVAISISFSFFKLIRFSINNNAFEFNLYHPDDRGGFSIIGSINTLSISCFLVFTIEILALFFTHTGRSVSLWIFLTMTIVLFIYMSYFNVLPVFKFLRNEKENQRSALYKSSNLIDHDVKVIDFIFTTQNVSYSPYTLKMNYLMKFFQLVTPTVALIGFFQTP